MQDIKDRIWITSRVRMISEKKCKNNQNISYLSITYYSIFIILITVFSDHYIGTYSALDQINLSATVVVLVASLVAAGFRFESAAAVFRDCYLKLQALHDDHQISEEDRNKEYRRLMLEYPNHSSSDYYDFLVTHNLLEWKTLKQSGQPVLCSPYMVATFVLRKLFFYSFVATLLLAPIAFLAWPFIQASASVQVGGQ